MYTSKPSHPVYAETVRSKDTPLRRSTKGPYRREESLVRKHEVETKIGSEDMWSAELVKVYVGLDSVNGHFYVQVLQRLWDAVRRKRRNKQHGQWFLHPDNAPSHTSLVVQLFLAEKNILPSSNHLTLRISLPEAPRFKIMEGSNRMRRSKSGIF
jgi:hypothetical protein